MIVMSLEISFITFILILLLSFIF